MIRVLLRIFSNVLIAIHTFHCTTSMTRTLFLFVTHSSFLPLCPSRRDMFLFQMRWADDFDMPHLLAISLKFSSPFSLRKKALACLNALNYITMFTGPRTYHTNLLAFLLHHCLRGHQDTYYYY